MSKVEDVFEARESYDALLQSVTDYVIAINRNLQIIHANDLFKEEFGMHPDAFCYKVWKKRDSKCENCLVQKSFEDGQFHWNVEQVVMRNDRSAQMLINSTPVKDEKGRVMYVLETATDITERRHLQNDLDRNGVGFERKLGERLRNLQKSEERYRSIFERSNDAIILADQEGNILEINQAGVELFGYRSREEMPDRVVTEDFFENRDVLRRFRREVYGSGFVNEFEARLVGNSGRVFDALVTSNVTGLGVHGRERGYVVIIRDETGRKEAQRQIENKNARLAALNAISTTVSSSLEIKEVLDRTIDKILQILEPDSVRIYLVDESGGFLHLAAHRGLSEGFVRKNFIQKRRLGDGLLGKAFNDATPRVFENVQRSGDPYVESIVKEGLITTAYIPLASKGKPLGVMCVSSHSKRRITGYQVEFLTAIGNQIGMAVDNANLYNHLNRAYEDLKSAQEQVIRSEKLASLGKLSATIAHEINNPLASVLNYIRLMSKMLSKGSFSKDRFYDIERYLDTMETETARCGEIVKNLLTFSRQSRMTIETNHVQDIIDKALVLLSHDLKIKGIRTETDIQEDLPGISCDFRQIQQCFINLLANASESMPEGGTLKVKARLHSKGKFVEILISDTGTGIPEDELKSIFEPFFTTKEEGKGVGLGLSVVYGIISRHKGSIEVNSRPGEGTTFSVRLPLAGAVSSVEALEQAGR
jgi:PAS domain S-box-containing protein